MLLEGPRREKRYTRPSDASLPLSLPPVLDPPPWRQQTLINLSLERLSAPVVMEQEEMLERQEVIRKLTSQRLILANA
eukprot:1789920-Pyramimonas_sp.AAC.1